MNTLIIKTSMVLIASTLIVSISPDSSVAWKSPLVDGFTVVRPFDLSNGTYNKGHRGIDLFAETDQPIASPISGVISFAGMVADRPVISITFHDKSVLSIEPVDTQLQVGDNIKSGDIIGTVGKGGHCNQNCIHLGVRIDNKYFNPLRWFRKHPVLLPRKTKIL